MVKAYLRYENDKAIGVVTSRECNVVLDRSGKFALAGCVETVVVWNVRQGAQVRVLRNSKSVERVTRICLKESDDKPICAVGYADGSVRLWNYEDSSILMTLQGHRSAVSCLAFDRSGHLLASGSSDTDVVIWDIVSETGVARLRGHVDQVTAVLFWEPRQVGSTTVSKAKASTGDSSAVTSSTRIISSSKDRFVRIWSAEMQLCLQTIAEHKVEVWSLALNACHTRLVCGSGDKFLRLFALHMPEAQASISSSAGSEDAPLASFLGAVPRPKGQGGAIGLEFVKPSSVGFEVLLCQGAGKALELFRCHDDDEVKKRLRRRKQRARAKQKKKAGEAGVEDADGDQEQAESALDSLARAADELEELPAHKCGAKAASVAWCPKTSTVLLGLSNNTLETLRLKAGDADEENGKATLITEGGSSLDAPGHRTAVRALAVSHDDSLLMSASAEAIKVWNTATGNCVRTIASGYGLCCFFVAGNEHVVLGTKEGHLELYDLKVAELAERIEAHEGAVYGLAEMPDRKGFISCSADKYVRSFNFTFTKAAGAETVSIDHVDDKALELPDECLACAYSANGKWLAVALLNHQVQMFFADSMKFYLSLYGHRLPVMALDLSSDSQILASGSADKNVKLWSTQFGNCHRSLRAHDESVMQVRFLPGTHYLVTAGRDREVKLWDCDSYELITTLQGHATEILAMALSQDAAFIVTAGGDRQVRFWKRSQEQLFLSEERAKELEDKFEQEVEREDIQAPGAGAQVVAPRPSRRTIESVRTTERLMEILDEAKDLAEGKQLWDGTVQSPCLRVCRYLNTLTASNIYEVLLCLPFSHAHRLLRFICDFLEAVASIPDATNSAAKGDKVLSAAATLETPCQAALITAYVHHSELAATTEARTLLLRLKKQMRSLLQAEKDRIGFSMAGISHLQRTLKRASALREEPLSSPGVSASKRAPSGGAPVAKKRKR